MPLNSTAIVRILQEISVLKGLNCTVTESGKAALTAGGFAFVGGLIGGPIGLGIGGTVGSILAAVRSQGKFKSVAEVLSEDLSPMQLRQLEVSFRDIFLEIDANDVATAMTIIMNSGNLQALILKQIGVFLKNEMGLALA